MSLQMVRNPLFEVTCDEPLCDAIFHGDINEWCTRVAARKADWDVPPPRGKGARSGTDYCPEHAPTPRRWPR